MNNLHNSKSLKKKLRGFYQHYKGGIYYLKDIAMHTETEGLFVIYKDADGATWARPKYMFFESIFVVKDDEGNLREAKNALEAMEQSAPFVPRFTRIPWYKAFMETVFPKGSKDKDDAGVTV